MDSGVTDQRLLLVSMSMRICIYVHTYVIYIQIDAILYPILSQASMIYGA